MALAKLRRGTAAASSAEDVNVTQNDEGAMQMNEQPTRETNLEDLSDAELAEVTGGAFGAHPPPDEMPIDPTPDVF